MTGHGAKFGRKQEEAIAALLTHRTIEEAAKACGIAPRTLLRWLKVPEFKAAYRAARREAVGQAIARVQQATGAAASTFIKLMVDANSPHAVRLRAAECIFSNSIKAIELEDIEARVAELERATEANDASGRRR